MARKQAGIVVRHRRPCASRTGAGCNCDPRYEAWVWSPSDKKKIYRAFDSPTEAKNWRGDAGSAVRKGTMRVPTQRTVREACESWIAKAEAGEIKKPDGEPYKPAVLRNYRASLEQLVLPELGAARLARLQRRDVQALIERLEGKGLSGSTVRNAVMPLRAVCRRAVRDDELILNPTANLELPAAAGRRERVASPEEARSLIAALPETEQALWSTAFYAGLRRGELRGLRWDDIDDGVTVIHVQRGWDHKAGEIAPKSKKGDRRVPVVTELRLALLEHKARTGRRGHDLVFGRTGVLPFTPTFVRHTALRAWAARYTCGCEREEERETCRNHDAPGYVPIGLHELRHSFVSFMHDAGFSLERIGDYAGHSSAYMTDRYRHLLDGHEQEAADILDAYLARRTGAHAGVQAAAVASQPARLSRLSTVSG